MKTQTDKKNKTGNQPTAYQSEGSQSESYQRFHALHRILHIIIIFNFTLLTITGFLLHFSGFGWTSFIVSLMGGAGAIGWLHRFCGAFLYVGIVIHVSWLFYYKIVLKQKICGPDSVLPGTKDLKDLYQNLRYVFKKDTPPLFDRFSYLQKLDYWAVMLGMQSMGITGLLLCFSEFFAGILPGYFINIATHFHFHEAVLAVMYIAVIHMSDTHLVPDIFPLEKTIFTGEIEKIRFMEDHPEEWKRKQMINDPR
jgi:cytochrome b subunit of formate dehydrogenase